MVTEFDDAGEALGAPTCHRCGESYHPRRRARGYLVCLPCGDGQAQKEIAHKRKCTAPLYNKGGYGYVSTREQAGWVGRK